MDTEHIILFVVLVCCFIIIPLMIMEETNKIKAQYRSLEKRHLEEKRNVQFLLTSLKQESKEKLDENTYRKCLLIINYEKDLMNKLEMYVKGRISFRDYAKIAEQLFNELENDLKDLETKYVLQ